MKEKKMTKIYDIKCKINDRKKKKNARRQNTKL